MRLIITIELLAITVFLAGTLSFSSDPETKKIMPFIDDNSYCLKCHSPEEAKLIVVPSRSCATYCRTCHKEVDNKSHHTVGVKILEEHKKSFPYSRLGNVSCFTCHDLEKNRFDSHPWKAQSLFDKTFKKKNFYKTYYLVIQNDNGQLCKACH